MTPAARLQAAIDILATLETTNQPLDRYLRDFFRSRRYAGSKDRRAIAERVFDVTRHRASLIHRMGSADARALVIGALLEEGEDPELLFTGGYGPPPLNQQERLVIATTRPVAPAHVVGEYPLWLESQLIRAFGDGLAVEMAALQTRAPVDLRVNSLKATKPEVIGALQAAGFAAAPMPWAPFGVRIPAGEGSAALAKSALFAAGAFEFQDEAAQIAAQLAGASPGMRVLDLAAGAGGKALALAAAMNNEGEILAFDDNPQRLAPLTERAARAGASCIVAVDQRGGAPWGNGRFDLVFLDAPCSGTGTWRRQPELRWRLTGERLIELTHIQDGLLDEAGRYTAKGGRLVYATCSLLACENQDRIAAFLSRNPDFRVVEASSTWQGVAPPGLGTDFRASPAQTGTDGFYTAVLLRS